jgi:hypothetical protein
MLVIGTVTEVGAFMFSIYKIAKRVDQAIGVDAQGKTLFFRQKWRRERERKQMGLGSRPLRTLRR